MSSTLSSAQRAILLLVALSSALLCPLPALALDVRMGDQPSIDQDERIAEDVYLMGGNISSLGVVGGDLWGMGGNILVRGGIRGDLAAMGGAVTVLGDVTDDLRAAGGNLLIQGSVGGDLVLAGGQLGVGGAGVRGDFLGGGGTVRIDAPVGGDIRIAGGDIFLNAAVSGNVEVYAEKLTLGKGARISGNLLYTAVKEAKVEEGAVVSGETTFTKRDRTISVGGIAKVVSLALIATFLSQLATALLLGLFFRRYVLSLIENAVAQPLLETGRGLVVIITLPVISCILLFTVVGAPLGVFGLLSFAGMLIYLWVLTPILLGSLAYRTFLKGEYDVNWKTILLGVFIYSVLGLIPIVGWLTQILLNLLTLGVAAKVKWDLMKEWR